MTADELAEILPGRTPKAVSRIRDRYGRWRAEGVVPLCQRCGEVARGLDGGRHGA